MARIREPAGSTAEAGAEDGILDWRLKQLIAAGYEPDDALLLAKQMEIDLHLAADLPLRGCPHKTAVRILSNLPEPDPSPRGGPEPSKRIGPRATAA
jgi:hypothetical protein